MGSGLSIVALTDESDGGGGIIASAIAPTVRLPSHTGPSLGHTTWWSPYRSANRQRPQERSDELAQELSTLHSISMAPGTNLQARVLPLPSPEIVSSMLRRDLDRVSPTETTPTNPARESVTGDRRTQSR